MRRGIVAGLGLFFAAVVATGQRLDATLVQTAPGPITGLEREGVRAYLGIPYAAPPIGELRWKPPQPVAPWTEPRAMTEFGPGCPQHGDEFYGKVENQSEDCLTLNVWTAAEGADEKRPVMVWIHGGGFTLGGSSLPYYDGTQLARHGVVLVSINYRLGPFGFLAHPALTAESPDHVSGMYGLLDQIAALKWVQAEIAQFGGDPGNVTIFGESAGGVSVCLLMASPLAKGLFHRAICQSGSVPPRLRALAQAEAKGVAFAAALGVAEGPDALRELRALPTEAVLSAAKASSVLPGAGVQDWLCVDGYVLEEVPAAAFAAGKQTSVPFMAGTVGDEGSVFARRLPVKTVEQFRRVMLAVFRTEAPRAMALYGVTTDADVPAAVSAFLSDTFIAGARTAARNTAAIQPQTYLYHFTRTPPAAQCTGLGCLHGIEIPYVFQVAPRYGFAEEDRGLSEEMIGYWTRFARTGDPNGEGAVTWPRYTAVEDQHLVLDTRIGVGEHLRQEACDLLEARRTGF